MQQHGRNILPADHPPPTQDGVNQKQQSFKMFLINVTIDKT